MSSDIGSQVLSLAMQLVARQSVTPDDGGCQADLIVPRLEAAGFVCEPLPHGPVTNLLAVHHGSSPGPWVALAGHTDVVPPGNGWTTPPFTPTVRGGNLYGRASTDMKSAVAAEVVAVERFVHDHPRHRGAVSVLLTSCEESGPSSIGDDHGMAHIVDVLRRREIALDYCIIGEPTSINRLGDRIKNGHRGMLSGRFVVKGVQGHSAIPERASNAVHLVAPALLDLVRMSWDEGDEHFPPTGFQVSDIHAGTGAGGVIPGEVAINFDFRFGPASPVASLVSRVREVLDRHGLEYTLEWGVDGEPSVTTPGTLSTALARAIRETTGVTPDFSVAGGMSDARFLGPICREIMEFGLLSETMHQVDERVSVADLGPLARIYHRTLELLLA